MTRKRSATQPNSSKALLNQKCDFTFSLGGENLSTATKLLLKNGGFPIVVKNDKMQLNFIKHVEGCLASLALSFRDGEWEEGVWFAGLDVWW